MEAARDSRRGDGRRLRRALLADDVARARRRLTKPTVTTGVGSALALVVSSHADARGCQRSLPGNTEPTLWADHTRRQKTMALLQSLARGLVLVVLMSIALGLLAEVSKWVPDLTLEVARRGGPTRQPSSAITKDFC